jgi:hypothetical protein
VVTTETDESWRPGDVSPAFDQTIEAVLTSEGDTTRLVLEARGMPWEKIPYFGAGWQIHAEHLAGYLAGDESVPDKDARWEDLVPPYLDLAAAIGWTAS